MFVNDNPYLCRDHEAILSPCHRGVAHAPSFKSYGMIANFCGSLVMKENIIDDTSSPPVQFEYCNSAEFFANQSSAGTLLQGYNLGINLSTDELSTNIQDAAVVPF